MNLDILLLIFVGYLANISQSSGYDGKEVHFKILLPIYKHTHKHTHTVYKKPKEEKTIIIHNHHHKHDHKDEHEPSPNHGHKHKYGHKYKHGYNHKLKDGEHEYGHHFFYDWDTNSDVEPSKEEKPSKPTAEIKKLKTYGLVPTFVDKKTKIKPDHFIEFDDDGYLNSHKSLRTESFHLTEKKDSSAKDPNKKHYLTGNYKIVQKEPDDFTSNEYDADFHSPLSKKKAHTFSYQSKNPFSDEDLGYSDHENYHKESDEDDDNHNSGNYDYLKSAALVDYEIAVLEQLYNHF